MEHASFPSTALADVAYDAATQRLQIRFCDGRSYEYDKIPEDVYAALLLAASKGRYFNASIRGRFRHRSGVARNFITVMSNTTVS